MLVIGECVADIVRTPGTGDVVHPGGSPANVAYGLARLGHPTDFLTQLGEDRLGGIIGDHLRAAGVQIRTDAQPGLRTPSAVVHLDDRGAAEYTFDIAWTLREVEPKPADHVHVGSIGAVLRPGADHVDDVVRRMRDTATVSYDPNVRPALMGDRAEAVARVEQWVALSDVVKASEEDLDWLYPGRAPEQVAAEWTAAGPPLVLVTLGAEGALAATAERTVRITPQRVPVVDTVGAGDAFMSGTLHALAGSGLLGADARRRPAALDEAALRHVLAYATASAAVTVARAGANPPDDAELAAALARA